MKKLDVTCVKHIDKLEGCTRQELFCETDDVDFYYSVHNLNECPEDAILGRELFTAEDFVRTMIFGMELANKGYTDIVLNYDVEEE